MTEQQAASTMPRRTGSPAPAFARTLSTGVTAYGCTEGEARLFREVADRLGVAVTVTDAAISGETLDLACRKACVSIGHKTRVSNATLDLLSRAGVVYVSTRSTGLDHVDTEHADRLGIVVEPVAYSPDSVADYTLMLMLMGVRHAKPVVDRAQAHDFRLHDVPGRELRDMTVGVVGTGRIGSAVIDRLRGFGCRVVAHDSRPTSVPGVSLDELLDESDIVTLHVPLTPATHHLLDRERISSMKPDAYVVNTARGGLIDTEALVGALECGQLGGAALDVLEGEEGVFYTDCSSTPVAHPWLERLQRLPNVIISPHTAYYTDHALRDMVEGSVAGCVRFVSGGRHG
jgi:D-specific alpha-keto acid dehydrogenase